MAGPDTSKDALHLATEALVASERRLRLFVEHAPAAIAMVDSDMRYLAVSRRYLGDYRLAEASVIGRSHYELFPDLPEHWKEVHRRCLAGAVERNEEERFHRADGSVDWVKWEIHPWRTAAGEVGGLMLFTEVITRRKEAELALQQRNKLESIGRLAGGVAHDFNNLLTVILSCAQVVREEIAAGRLPELADVDEIADAGQRATELTRQLLTFARKQVIAPVALDLNATLKQSQNLLRRVLGENIVVEETLEPRLWPVRCDPIQVDQVILNLAVNARDAMPTGGEIVFETANVEVGTEPAAGMPALVPGQYVRFRVRDVGHGMTGDVLKHVFEPFFTTKPAGAGTGLGLATVYGIAEQNGGAVAADSAPGRGTTIDVYLPRASGSVERAPERGGPPRRGSESVLVVEDDGLVRGVTARSLRDAGYRVQVAASGQRALELISGEGAVPELLVTDVMMPGMDGRALAAEVRQRDPGVRVLFVSGYSDDLLSEGAVLSPGVDFLAKPFTPESLLATVRAVLDAD